MSEIKIPVTSEEAEDEAVEIQIEQELLDKADKEENRCLKCGSALIGEDSELQTAVCSNCL